MADPPNPTQRKASRLLAALDNPSSVLSTPEHPALGVVKHPLDSPGPSSGSKRRATGLGIHETANVTAEDVAATRLQSLSQLANSDPPSPSSPKKKGKAEKKGFSMHYDIEGPVETIDVGGVDQALRMAEFVTKAIDNSSHGLTVKAAMQDLGMNDMKDVLPGLEVRLLAHQLIGVSWMVRQERQSPHKGGILADDMGLGKTVQMIATMALNMPDDEEEYRTTLIVLPAALLLQWKEEIDQKTNGIFDIHIHHGKDKLKTLRALSNKDIIITTYQTLVNDFTAPANIDPDDIFQWVIENGGPLARMRWYRVVLDEAQFIRNRSTRASKAVAMLRARYRWCLTGTPVTNTLADLYGLLRFGRFRPWNDWYDFNEHIGKVQLLDAPLAGLRAQQILAPLILRRTKDSELEGEPILKLPAKHVELVRLEFSKDERELYDHIQRRAQIQINRYIRQGTIVKNHSAVLVLILRLRQLCCHPNLILSLSGDSNDPGLAVGSDAEKEFARASKNMGIKWALNIKKQFLERAKEALVDFDDDELEAPEGECPVCNDLFINDNGLVLECGHEICFDCCREVASAPIAHDGIFGEADEATNLAVERRFETAVAKGLRPCPTCKKMNELRPEKVFRSSAFQPTYEDLKAATRRRYPGPTKQISAPGPSSKVSVLKPAPKSLGSMKLPDLSDSSDDDLPDTSTLIKNLRLGLNKGKEKSAPTKIKKHEESDESEDDELTDITLKDITGPVPPPRSAATSAQPNTVQVGKPSEALIQTWRQGGANVEPSTKMLALIGFLQDWEATGDKTICFSQWTSMLDLVEMLLGRYGIQSLRYDGSMDRAAREAVLIRFRQPGGPRVILISIKCGGVGLNLVAANRIVNLDLSWNYASESQAYDRAHRLGQDKEVIVKRLVVNDTLEERMLKLQDTKTSLAEAALGEGSGIKLHKLSVKELKDLFGMSSKNNEPDPTQTQLSYT